MISIMISGVLNDKFVAGIIGLVPVHLPRSHPLQFVSVLVCTAVYSINANINISQCSVATHLRHGGIFNDHLITFAAV